MKFKITCPISYLLTTMFAMLFYQQSSYAMNVPDVYQESVLRRYRTYSDVSIFHYFVPTQVTRATWEFAAFMDDPRCDSKEVYIHIQSGSYPVINPDNSSFPESTFYDREQQYIVSTMSKYQSHDALVFHVFNPAPGSWFAVAYIPDWDHEIGQQGISHKCRYSLGSIASWSQHPDVMLLSPHVPTSVETSSQYTFFKFFVPENIWLVEVSLSNCTIKALLGISELDSSDLCAQGFGLQPDSLPFPADVNITVDTNFLYSQPQPRTQTYYYVLVASSNEIAFTITVNMKECVYGMSSSLFQEPSNIFAGSLYSSSFLFGQSSSTSSSSIILSSTNSSSIRTSFLGSRHSNQSVTQDWHDALTISNHTHIANFSSVPPTAATNTKHVFSATYSSGFLDQQKTPLLYMDRNDYASDQECLPMMQMARIKRPQDFTDTFLLQGKDSYTSLLGISDLFPVILKLELLPFLDIGGTLQIGARLVEPPESAVDQTVVVKMCVSYGQSPLNSNSDIKCQPELLMNMSLMASHSSLETVKYIPFPRPGYWFVGFLTKCYNGNISSTSQFRNEDEVPCRFELLMVYLNIRLQPCFGEGSSCGSHGVCEESHRGQFFFSTCRCAGGWRGWGCTDGSQATPKMSLLMRTILLTISNIFFIPPGVLAIKRKFYSEALVYTFTMFFSTFYHACDEELFSFCLMKYEVLQFCDFYSSILSFWVTIIALTNIPAKMSSVAHMAGALGIALGVEYQRTSLWVFLVPVGTGVVIMILCWVKECHHKKSCYPSKYLCLVSFLPGTILALMGLCLYAFVETESNYQYVHSIWHVIIALSVVFLLPRAHPDSLINDNKPSSLSNFQQQTQQQQNNYVRTSDDSELIDVSDYAAVTSDFQRLIY